MIDSFDTMSACL